MNSIDNPYYIAFCCDDNYSQYIRVTILSILENNPNKYIHVFLITEFISKKHRKQILELSDNHNFLTISIIIFDNSIFNEFPVSKGWPIQIWYRIMLPTILDSYISKVLYLDVDTLVVGDLSALFSIDMHQKSIAATPEANYFNPEYYQRLGLSYSLGYVCAGVFLMNLDYWRIHDLSKKALEWTIENKTKLKLLDQDVLNYICRDSKIILPLKYGVVQWYYVIEEFYKNSFYYQLIESLNSPVIIHYAFTPPWYKDCHKHIFHDLWISYNNKLKKPVRLKYKSKGFFKLKMMIWNFFHHHEKKPCISKESILNKIKNSS